MLYLAKSPGPHPVSFCSCPENEALIAFPGQMDCPWCGCGWFFSCTHCRKGFTFATAIEVPLSLSEIAEADIRRFGMDPTTKTVDHWVQDMTMMLDGIVLGEKYAYLDGAVRAPGREAKFSGWYGSHSLPQLPQHEPGASGDWLEKRLGRNFWDRALANSISN